MRVLVIEDYELLRESLREGLREAGYAADVAADGKTGLWMATGAEYDVIILDVMLPEIDGITLLKKLREAKSDASVLILTARDATEDRILGLDAGADDYLVKPFAFAELLARVRAMVRRGYRSKNPVIEIEDLCIDTTSRTVRRADVPVELTAREFALLEYLAMRSGAVVSRTEIWEHLYELHCDAGSNVVDVYIGHLRRKLEKPGQSRLIHTRRGQGYMLGVDEVSIR